MKRFFHSAWLMAVISLLVSVIWPAQSSAAMPTITSLGQIRAQGLNSPGAMAVDAAGNLYVADARGGEVFKFDRYGRQKAVFSVQASGSGLAVAPGGGRLYVARKQSVALVDPASGDVLGELAGEPFAQVGELALDDDGNLYVADAGSQALTVSVISPAGAVLAKVGGVGVEAGKFMQLGGLAVNSLGRLVAADRSSLNGRIQVFTFDPVSFAVTKIDSYATTSAANFGVPGIVVPAGMAFDDQGRGYFLDFLKSQVRVTDPSMTYLGSYGQAGSNVGQLAYVKDVVVETRIDSGTGKANIRLFVSCDDSRVEVFGIDGGINPPFVNLAPGVPVPLSPVADSEVASAVPTLQFAAATDPDGDELSYQVSVYRGGQLVSRMHTSATAVEVPAGLLIENAAYSWTVEAFDREGAGSGVSLPGTFVVNAVNEAPSAPALIFPLAGEVLAGDGVLAWQASVDPDPNDTLLNYQVEVAGTAGFAAPLLSARVNGLQVALSDFAAYAALVDGSDYLWRVTAIDSAGLGSATGASGQFVYDTAVLKVTANMPDARVYLGGNHAFAGRLVGTAPVELRDLAPGALSVVVERAGFEPYVAQVMVTGAGNAAVYAPLVPVLQPTGFQLVNYGVNGRPGLAVNGPAVPFLIDFNNDGQLDLLVGSASGQVSLFLAKKIEAGRLTFQPAQGVGLPVMPGAVPFVADWDNDGRKDLLVGQADGTIKLFLNRGEESAPAFGAGQDLVLADGVLDVGEQAAPALVDLDADGNKDLVVGNAAGQVVAFMNQGSDAAPQLATPVVLAQVTGAAVPFPVDMDADGRRDLLVTVNGQAILFRNDLAATGTFVATSPLAGTGFNAVFPLELNGNRGKDLFVGQVDGKLSYWTSNGSSLTAAALAGLLVKVDEVKALVAGVAPELVGTVNRIRRKIEETRLTGAAVTAESLVPLLPPGAARDAMVELSVMCRVK